jgi:hypothetical protein
MFKIEKGVPIPAKRTNRATGYPWGQMEVGDSFYAPGKRSADFSAYRAAALKHGIRYTVRKEGDGVRVWRVQ